MKKLKLATRESSVEDYLVQEVKKRHGKIYKTICVGQNGFPDRDIYFPYTIHMLVECKKPTGGVLSKHQIKVHSDLKARGHNVFVAHTKELVDALMQMVDQRVEEAMDEAELHT